MTLALAPVPTTPASMSLGALALRGPGGSLDAYIDTVSRIPVLSKDEEVRLARRYREENDLDAARSLVMSHLRFVVHIARGYTGYGLPMGDLVQEGNVGLMKAVKRFDPTVGVRLVSFAVHWIRATVSMYASRLPPGPRSASAPRFAEAGVVGTGARARVMGVSVPSVQTVTGLVSAQSSTRLIRVLTAPWVPE